MAKVGKKEVEEKIFQVAQNMVLHYGVKGLNMNDLAAECGVAKGTLYKIIGTKEDLIQKIAFEIFNQNSKVILEPFRAFEDYDEIISCFLDRYLNLCAGYERVLTQQIYREYPGIESLLDEHFQKDIKVVRDRFEQWQQEGVIRKDISPENIVTSMAAINDHFVKSELSDEKVVESLLEIFRFFLNSLKV
ncbi:MAG: TetR/AcrR family transcriptional regulator [Marinifilaceae bacterium]|jgi:AcrR family transcriptional regulator